MQTIYIDVYFLVNFTVDILALYFGASFSKTPTTVKRLIVGALVGALSAVFAVLFIDIRWIFYPLTVALILVTVSVVAGRISLFRKVKLCVAFLLFEVLFGGLVYYGYLTLDTLSADSYFDTGGENRSILILSLLILLSIGIIKLGLLFFSNVTSERTARITVLFSGREYVLDALIDSGNLALDPLDRTPVMLITGKEAKRIFGSDITNTATLDYNLKRKIRIIPIKFGQNQTILYGIKPDAVYANAKGGREKISVVLAVDGEGRGYGAYSANLPLSALENIKL